MYKFLSFIHTGFCMITIVLQFDSIVFLFFLYKVTVVYRVTNCAM
jgi:hypothetical protein